MQLYESDASFERVNTRVLGTCGNAAEPVHVVVAGAWQAAQSTGEYSLVACTVAPGFDYADFTMLRDLPAAANAFRHKHPQLASMV